MDKTTERYLRVGLLLDSFVQPRWAARVVRDIQSSDFAEVALVVQNAAPPAWMNGRRANPLAQAWRNRPHLLYALYTKLDERLSRAGADAFSPADIAEEVAGCPVVKVEPVRRGLSETFREEDVRAIRAYDLDVVLRLGFGILKGDALRLARHGVWSYHHGDPDSYRGMPPGFWEVMGGEATVGAVLQVLTEELDNGHIISRGCSPTTNRFSVSRNNNNYYWGASQFVLRKLRQLHAARDEGLPADPAPYRPYYNRLYKKPTNAEMLPAAALLAGRAVSRLVEKLFFENQWTLAYRFRSGPDDPNNSFYKFKYLTPPRGRFWADPFPVKVAGRYYIFFEDSSLRSEKGHIAVVEVDRRGAVGEPVKALEAEHHLSYPFVFEWGGALYMLPETGARRAVELYRCVEFPHRWEPERVLLEDLDAYDATLAEVEGRWWMFLTLWPEGVRIPCEELHLFHAESPLGPWRPHRKNPVKIDARSARPAGRLFRWRGELYRPAQDCSKHYGYAMTINRVVRLDAQEFREEEAAKILPRWRKGLVSTHTLNSWDDLTVVDCQLRRGRFFRAGGA